MSTLDRKPITSDGVDGYDLGNSSTHTKRSQDRLLRLILFAAVEECILSGAHFLAAATFIYKQKINARGFCRSYLASVNGWVWAMVSIWLWLGGHWQTPFPSSPPHPFIHSRPRNTLSPFLCVVLFLSLWLWVADALPGELRINTYPLVALHSHSLLFIRTISSASLPLGVHHSAGAAAAGGSSKQHGVGHQDQAWEVGEVLADAP